MIMCNEHESGKPTPGPWSKAETRTEGFVITSLTDLVVHSVDEYGHYGPIKSSANANLIAAAPRMLEALEAAVKWHESVIGESYFPIDTVPLAECRAQEPNEIVAMTDLNKLSPTARSAAMRGGTSGWGQVGGVAGQIRYMELRPKRPGRKPKCNCGCDTPKTHTGFANGVCLTGGCEMYVRRWVKAST